MQRVWQKKVSAVIREAAWSGVGWEFTHRILWVRFFAFWNLGFLKIRMIQPALPLWGSNKIQLEALCKSKKLNKIQALSLSSKTVSFKGKSFSVARWLVRSRDDGHKGSDELVVNPDRLCDSCRRCNTAKVILLQFPDLIPIKPATSDFCLFLSVLEKPVTMLKTLTILRAPCFAEAQASHRGRLRGGTEMLFQPFKSKH